MKVTIPAAAWRVAGAARAAHILTNEGDSLCGRAGGATEWGPAQGEGKCRHCIEATASRYGSPEWRDIIDLEVVCE